MNEDEDARDEATAPAAAYNEKADRRSRNAMKAFFAETFP